MLFEDVFSIQVGLRRDRWPGFCKHGNEPSCFIFWVNYFQKRPHNHAVSYSKRTPGHKDVK
jgi:hypothetical protein